MGLDARKWVTLGECKIVLVIVHTITSGQRLLDAVQLIESDRRVQVVYTIGPDVFGHGVEAFLEDIGAITVPWQQATNSEFDLALAASLGGLHEIHAPVVVMPHGAGHNKLVARRAYGHAVGSRHPYGLDPQRLLYDGTLVPTALVLSHQADVGRLARSCPEALSAACVVGDPGYDRLQASLGNRSRYREALRLKAAQKLVVVSSSWGPKSLLSRRFDLLPRLLGELSREDYRVLALLHPNAWFGHGTRQIRAWLGDCLRTGLSLLPPEADWRAALAAADCVIGDYGSLILYGAAARVPVLSAAFPSGDVDPDSAMGVLAGSTPRIPREGPVRQVIEQAFAQFHPDLHEAAIRRITSAPGRFNRNMRHLLYRLLELPQPPTLPVTLPVPPAFLRK